MVLYSIPLEISPSTYRYYFFTNPKGGFTDLFVFPKYYNSGWVGCIYHVHITYSSPRAKEAIIIWEAAQSLNWYLDGNDPNTFQVYLQALEASFEAAPQCVVQFIFVLRTNTIQTLALISIFFSVWSIINSVVKDDRSIFIESARTSHFGKPCCRVSNYFDNVEYRSNAVHIDLSLSSAGSSPSASPSISPRPEYAKICFVGWEFATRLTFRIF